MTAPGFGRGLAIVPIARQIQTTVIAHYATAGFALPDKKFLVPGDPEQAAWDCPQFTVGLAGVGWGWAVDNQPPSSPKLGSQVSAVSLRHVVFTVQIVRCTPSNGRDGKPNAEDIDAAGEEAIRDAGLLSQALVMVLSEINNNQLRNSAGKAQAGAIVPLGPTGGHHGVGGTLSVTAGNLV